MHQALRPILAAGIAALAVGAAAQQDRALIERSIERAHSNTNNSRPAVKPGQPTPWNDSLPVLFKGVITGRMASAPYTNGKSYFLLLVKLKNGGTAMVELGPTDYVEAQGLDFRMGQPIWIAGCKSWTDKNDSVILAERVNYEGFRPSFRRKDGTPFWEKAK